MEEEEEEELQYLVDDEEENAKVEVVVDEDDAEQEDSDADSDTDSEPEGRLADGMALGVRSGAVALEGDVEHNSASAWEEVDDEGVEEEMLREAKEAVELAEAEVTVQLEGLEGLVTGWLSTHSVSRVCRIRGRVCQSPCMLVCLLLSLSVRLSS